MDECKPKQHTAVPTTSLHSHVSSQLLTSFITSDQQTVAHNSTAIPVQLTPNIDTLAVASQITCIKNSEIVIHSSNMWPSR
ncbi:unnamed protein product [Acanthoscelides obtectus]|uniref:Uncharacterized protein n=1 Tax=Acanthoscelides obtectus TaxID=200917 RepID=A0A9P0PJU6_ACAOB|nr:unnamed protein product [Acanthoscelides obtectus]CAK1681029.1 hypothetical protein AOBTE_LOCUS32985 [Acanthoscelides obtectus]